MNNKNLSFVLKYYREGKLDTKRAIQKVRERTMLSDTRTIPMQRWIAIAASLLLLLIGGATYYYIGYNPEVVLTAHEQPQLFILPDQTHVTLSSHATLSYKKKDVRTMTLKGDAYFEVQHDEQHPFIVRNEMAQVRVLGTGFQVSGSRSSQKLTEVYVTHGKVAFSSPSAEAQGVVLTQGMKAQLVQGEHKPQLIPAGSINQVAWATGNFHFENTPLTEVINDLETFYHVKLSVNSSEKNLTGDFSTESMDEIISLIEQTLEVSIVKNNP